jgi:hypothetical protein
MGNLIFGLVVGFIVGVATVLTVIAIIIICGRAR